MLCFVLLFLLYFWFLCVFFLFFGFTSPLAVDAVAHWAVTVRRFVILLFIVFWVSLALCFFFVFFGFYFFFWYFWFYLPIGGRRGCTLGGDGAVSRHKNKTSIRGFDSWTRPGNENLRE